MFDSLDEKTKHDDAVEIPRRERVVIAPECGSDHLPASGRCTSSETPSHRRRLQRDYATKGVSYRETCRGALARERTALPSARDRPGRRHPRRTRSRIDGTGGYRTGQE